MLSKDRLGTFRSEWRHRRSICLFTILCFDVTFYTINKFHGSSGTPTPPPTTTHNTPVVMFLYYEHVKGMKCQPWFYLQTETGAIFVCEIFKFDVFSTCTIHV